MVVPDTGNASLVLSILFVALVTVLMVRAIRKDRREFTRFKRFRTTERRKKMYRKWLIDSVVTFGASALAVLSVVYQYVPLLQRQVESFAWVRSARRQFADAGGVAVGVVVAASVLIVVGTVVAILLVRNTESVAAIGDIQALLPRNRAELGYGAALSVNAGVVEELLFRLALPALIFGITGDAVVSMISSLLLFGVLHVYQGIVGVLASTVIGAFLMFLYFATGNILVPIVVHALIDLRSLVLIPIVVGRVHRIDGSVSVYPRAGAHAARATRG